MPPSTSTPPSPLPLRQPVMPRRLRGEFAHRLLFQDIFQRGQPHHLAAFIHHDGDAALIPLKILQLVNSGVPAGTK